MPGPTKTSTGFASLNDYLNANRTAATGLGGTLADAASAPAQQGQADANGVAQQVYNQAAASGQNVDPTAVDGYGKAQGELAAGAQALGKLGDFGADAAGLRGVYGKLGGYSSGDSAFDANLAGAGGQGAMRAAQSRFSGLDSYLGSKTDEANKAGTAAYRPPVSGFDARAAQVSQTPVGATNVSPNFGGSENVNNNNPGTVKNRPNPVPRSGMGGL